MGLRNLAAEEAIARKETSNSTPRVGQISEKISLSWTDSQNKEVSTVLVGLIDSGAEVSCVNAKIVQDIKKRDEYRRIATAGGSILADIIPAMRVALRNFRLKVDIVVLPLGEVDMIVGMDILSAVGAVISCNPPGLKLKQSVGGSSVPLGKSGVPFIRL